MLMMMVALKCSLFYDVCRIMMFVALWCLSHYDVCHIMMFVALWCLSHYNVCCIMTIVALWCLSPYDVCCLWGLMACCLWRLSQCPWARCNSWAPFMSVKQKPGFQEMASLVRPRISSPDSNLSHPGSFIFVK